MEKKLSKELSVPLLGAIPINKDIREGGDIGKPIVDEKPESDEAKKNYRDKSKSCSTN